ncbi:hypothetical protein AMATHDRAFT_70103 [Amanita thiersii Skay4041]|uniref:Uncharacterized protein n=1 Tax=Amanita thiersii Skay4041 TaxID=703135 RepID=A0A2A9N7F9_9AGAR|nr:hypothetical protein AMATHDRAFT_70103 [Amanita thiersii Skay4041]
MADTQAPSPVIMFSVVFGDKLYGVKMYYDAFLFEMVDYMSLYYPDVHKRLAEVPRQNLTFFRLFQPIPDSTVTFDDEHKLVRKVYESDWAQIRNGAVLRHLSLIKYHVCLVVMLPSEKSVRDAYTFSKPLFNCLVTYVDEPNSWSDQALNFNGIIRVDDSDKQAAIIDIERQLAQKRQYKESDGYELELAKRFPDEFAESYVLASEDDTQDASKPNDADTKADLKQPEDNTEQDDADAKADAKEDTSKSDDAGAKGDANASETASTKSDDSKEERSFDFTVEDPREFLAFHNVARCYVDDAKRLRPYSPLSTIAAPFKAAFIHPTLFFNGNRRRKLYYREEVLWNVPLFTSKWMTSAHTTAVYKYSPKNDFDVIAPYGCPLVICKVASTRQVFDLDRMLVEAAAAARLGDFMMKLASTRRFFVIAICLTPNLILQRYIVTKSSADDQVYVAQHDFDLKDRDQALDYLREMYNLVLLADQLARDLDPGKLGMLRHFTYLMQDAPTVP